MSEERLVVVARRLATTLTPGDLDGTLSRVTAAAVEVLPEVEYASITVLHGDDRLETVAPTDDLLLDLEAAEYELGEGPCYKAAVDTAHITAPNLAADPRFPRYGPVAVTSGIRAGRQPCGCSMRPSRGAHSICIHAMSEPSRTSARCGSCSRTSRPWRSSTRGISAT